MIKLAIRKGKLELIEHSNDATLAELLEVSESFVSELKKQSVQCRMCGECCQREPVLGLDMILLAKREGKGVQEWAAARLMPCGLPDMAAREKGIAELRSQTGLSGSEAAVLYEYNQSEPLSFKQNENERCFYQNGNLCSNYADRPYICRLYLCKFGDKLQDLLEMVVTQGTWHAYSLLGGVPEAAIPHNPFLKAESFSDVRLKDFEFGLEKAMKELFSYF